MLIQTHLDESRSEPTVFAQLQAIAGNLRAPRLPFVDLPPAPKLTCAPDGRQSQSVPLNAIPVSYEESMKSLPEARKHADDLLVYDNTADGKGHRLVARFIAGELVKITHSSPEWLKDVFGRELRAEGKQQERPARRR